MQLGLIGLGKMGGNMARRLTSGGHEVVGHDISRESVEELAGEGVIVPAPDLATLVRLLRPPRAVWVMVPAGVTGRAIAELEPHLEPEDVVIDGGNGFYRDDVDRAERLTARGVGYVDVGVSGGVWGLEHGYCLMVGGEEEAVERLAPIFRTLAPGAAAAARTRGRAGPLAPEEEGWLHCGPAGAGHFAKMVHNGIEYGMMAALAEGFSILERADVGLRPRGEGDTAPLRDAGYYRYRFDLPGVAELWRRGTVIRSWLLDLTASALRADPDLQAFTGHVSDSGEGRWTVQAAVDEGVPANVIASALHQRFSSRDLGEYGDKVLSAMRMQFGGHHERTV